MTEKKFLKQLKQLARELQQYQQFSDNRELDLGYRIGQMEAGNALKTLLKEYKSLKDNEKKD